VSKRSKSKQPAVPVVAAARLAKPGATKPRKSSVATSKPAHPKLQPQALPPQLPQQQAPESSEAPLTAKKAAGLPFPVVGVGASAGGLEALIQLLQRLPPQPGIALVLILHLEPKHHSLTAEILGRSTIMPVVEAVDGVRLQVNRVYVIPPGFLLTILNGRLLLLPRTAKPVPFLPVDFFLSALAAEAESAAMGVVLSGTAADGTQGLLAIKAAGGLTFAQDPASAKYPGMPESAIASGAVDFVLTPEGIADEITRIVQDPYVAVPPAAAKALGQQAQPLRSTEEALYKIFSLLCSRHQSDFTHYKRSTILRRLARRMLVVKSPSIQDYADYLSSHPDEGKVLIADILIHVTSFFRDPGAFASLQTKILPALIKEHDRTVPLRVWVSGCSTGQEAYSLAILMMEYFEKTKRQIGLQIFATDISDAAIAIARTGIYADAVINLTKKRQGSYFDRVSGGYRVKKHVRDVCIFSTHDVTRDPPFARVDLIACRNLLIYFDDELQKRVFPTFHYALNPNGILFLGKAENISGFTDLFLAVDPVHKIFKRKQVKTPMKPYVPMLRSGSEGRSSPLGLGPKHGPSQSDLQKELDRIALKDYAPASVIVNASMDILQVRGRTAPYLELSSGQPILNLLNMARPELIADLRSLLSEAHTKKAPAKKSSLRVLAGNDISYLNLKVTPLSPLIKTDEPCYAIFFEAVAAPPAEWAAHTQPLIKGAKGKAKAGIAASSDAGKAQLLELAQAKAKQEHLLALNEEYEASQEELTASNEELQSLNEELQSTSEEMETGREELQSSNEELTTVNDELQARNLEILQLSNDLLNLLASADIPIVLLGGDGRIRRFTPQAERQFRLLAGDVGRKISDLNPDLTGVNLEAITYAVMKSGTSQAIETQDAAGHWFLLKVQPYRKANGPPEGAVLALIDIHAMKLALNAAQTAEKQLAAARADALLVIELNPIPLLVVTAERKIMLANQAFKAKFAIKVAAGQALAELNSGSLDHLGLLKIIDQTLTSGTELQNFEFKYEFPNIGLKVFVLNARRIHLPGGDIETALIAFDDYTERRHHEDLLKASEERHRSLVESSYDGCGSYALMGASSL